MRILEAHGFVRRGGCKHDVYVREGHPVPVVVPRHRGDLPIGTAAAIWRAAGIDPSARGSRQ